MAAKAPLIWLSAWLSGLKEMVVELPCSSETVTLGVVSQTPMATTVVAKLYPDQTTKMMSSAALLVNSSSKGPPLPMPYAELLE